MNLAIVILFVAGIANILIGLFVLLKNPRSVTNQLFAVLSLSLIGWSASNYFSVLLSTPEAIFSSVKVVFLFVILQNTSYFLLIYNFPHTHWRIDKRIIFPYLLLTLVVSLLVITNNIFGYKGTVSTFELSPTPLVALFILQAIFSIGGGIYILIRRLGKSSGRLKAQYRILLDASIFLLVFVPLTNFILPLFFKNAFFVQFSPLYTLVFASAIAFAIISQKLFDIRAAVARSVAFVMTITVIAVIYGFGAFQIIHNIFFSHSQSISLAEQAAYVLLAVILAFTFVPIRRAVEKLTDRIFYRDKYDPQQLVNESGRIMASEIDLEKLCNKVLSELTKQMRLSFGDIVVFSKKEVHFQTRMFSPAHHDVLIPDLKKLGRLAVVADELAGGERKEVMQKYNYSVSLALRTKEEFIGYLLLGEKKSGDIYNSQDMQVLKIIANELSVAVQNAKAFTEIQLFNVTLQEKVDLATKKLRKANDELKELDKAKDEFISMASHQLRTPLTTVKGYASMLEEGDFGKLNKEQQDKIELTLDGSNRMARLIDDLLNVSRMDANRFFLEANKVDLGKLVPEELTQLKSMATTKNIHLTYHQPHHKIPIITLDENKTRQVIMNLTDNAIHYSSPPDGGGHVAVSLELVGEYVEFKVVDDGIGVPENAQSKLFTKMFRAPNAQGVRPDGTGLGLYLVKRVVEEQGGEVIFESEPGKGSTFGFRLPLSGIPKEVLEQSKKIGARVAASHK